MSTAPKLVSQTEFKIEKGVRLPAAKTRNGKYPWAQMEVGDSFYIEGRKRGAIHSAACSWADRKRLPMKFSTAEEGVGVRIWRTA